MLDIKNAADKRNWTQEEVDAYHYSEKIRQDEKGKTDLSVEQLINEMKK